MIFFLSWCDDVYDDDDDDDYDAERVFGKNSHIFPFFVVKDVP